jgi:ubiquinone/menaquinone biosynthesis C-methylase UbiE
MIVDDLATTAAGSQRRIHMSRQASDKRAQRLRRHWDKHARTYDKQMAFWERRLFGDGRHWVCAQASGEVLEVAIGTGRNLPFYPKGIRLTGVDFSAAMLELARRQADQLGRKADLRLGDAQALDLPDASFDTVVCTLSLCAIPDERRAIAEMRRVLRPGGRLLLLDHVAAAPPNGCWNASLSRSGVSTCGADHCGRCRLRASRSSGENDPSSGS